MPTNSLGVRVNYIAILVSTFGLAIHSDYATYADSAVHRGKSAPSIPYQPQLKSESDSIPNTIDRIPRNRRIDSSSEAVDSSIQPPALAAVFSEPCHFVPEESFGCELGFSDTKLVIYENMQLIVRKDGQYELSFVAEAPRMPVTLKLQLVLTKCDASDANSLACCTITIPPILFEPSSVGNRQESSQVFLVHRTGYSHCLKDSGSSDGWLVRRDGFARFGGLPENNQSFTAARSE